MSWARPVARDIRTIAALTRSAPRHLPLPERLDAFYGRQAEDYDRFRERLLPGRRDLIERLPLTPGAVWVDLGGGTARNLLFAASRLPSLSQVVVIDLCRSLLDVAQARVNAWHWRNVSLVRADASLLPLRDAAADVVTCSYALTMMPGWERVLDEIGRVLAPGGTIGIVDFYVSSPRASAPLAQHGAIRRAFWPWWFRRAHVFLNGDHLPALVARFDTLDLHETLAPVPFMPAARVPVYRFVGRDRREPAPLRIVRRPGDGATLR